MMNHAISMFFIALLMSSSLCSIDVSPVRATDAAVMPFTQELDIMFDAGLEAAMFQPVDVRIHFEKPCWAIDETTHAVRVAYDPGFGLTEIESQIYDLEFSDESHISACSLVFLIPEDADGTETYYICYDTAQTKGPTYRDHVSVEDASYFYEPMTGLLIDIDYYKVMEEESVLYAVMYNGEVLGISMGHHVYKMKPESHDFEFANIEQTASFNMEYSADPSGTYLGTHTISDMKKSILVDGNLMVRFNIKIVSEQGNIVTDNIYSYYYQPGDTKSLDVKVHHEVLEDIQVKGDKQKDGTYCFLSTFKARSATITSLNIGEIMPKVHVYAEDDMVNEYDVPVDPDMYPPSWLIQTSDDIDLGTHAWVSMDDPTTGRCYALLFGATTGLVDDNTDGLQMKLSTAQQVKLPGMEADTCDLMVTRNAYEKGNHETTLEKGFEVICDVRFASFTTGGVEAVDAMSTIYQPAVAKRPVTWKNITEEHQIEEKTYSLTVFVKNAISPPMGPLLAIVTGKKIPYIYAEVYQEGTITSSSSASRLPLCNLNVDFDTGNLFDTIQTIVGLFDWKNVSLFKKCIFPALEAGTYVVKIFKENPLFAKERQFIGFGIIDLQKDDTLSIGCRKQGTIAISLYNQETKGIENAKVYLLNNDVVISDDLSDENGYAVLHAPCFPLQPYTLRVVYNGFLLEEREVTLRFINHVVDETIEGDRDLYDLQLHVKDTWGFPSSVEVNPTLTSDDMFESVPLLGEKIGDGTYIFRHVIASTYTLSMDYKSVHVEQDLSITHHETREVLFPAEYRVTCTTMNSYGMVFPTGNIRVSRGTKEQYIDRDDQGTAIVMIPPGAYQLSVLSEERELAQQRIVISSDKEINVITSEQSFIHSVTTVLGILLAFLSLGYILLKRTTKGFKVLALSLILLSLVSPWWMLHGEEGSTVTDTQTLLFPPTIVTRTSSHEGSGGEISQIPEDVTMIIGIFSFLLVLAGICFCISMFTELKSRKTTLVLVILGVVLVAATIAVFYVMYSMLAEFSVGSVIGSGDLAIKIPGDAGSTIVPCTWGFGLSFYLGIATTIIMVFSLVLQKFKVLSS